MPAAKSPTNPKLTLEGRTGRSPIPTISVILPTYKRADSALECLASLQTQTFGDFEVVVVDNGVETVVREMVERFGAAATFSLKYVPEARLGLHYARHAGARAAKADILVFTDDDATVDEGWLEAYARAFKEHPEIAGATGPANPVWEELAPAWVENMMGENGHLGFLSLVGEGPNYYSSLDQQFYGVNMAIRRKTLFDVGGFNPESYGDIWLGDGETGLSHKVHRQGGIVAYVPDAIVWHHIPGQRLTIDYYRRRIANQGAADCYSRFNRNTFSRLQLAVFASKIAAKYWPFWLIDLFVKRKTDSHSLRLQLRAVATRARVAYAIRLMFSSKLRRLVHEDDWIGMEQ